MTFDELPAELWPLADAAQEVLLDRQPSVRLLAPVPLRQLDTDAIGAAEPYRPQPA
jgi:hypothetical protein